MSAFETTHDMTVDSSRVRVALLGPHLGAVSGVSTHLKNLLSSDLQRDYELIHFRVGRESPQLDAHTKPTLIRVLLDPLNLAWQCVSRDIKIVHINTSMEVRSFWRDTLNLLMVKLVGRRVIYQIHGGELPTDFLRKGWLQQSFLKLVLRLPDVIVVLAEVELAAYQAYLPSAHISLIPNAIDCSQSLRPRQPRDTNAPLSLLYAGRLAHDKGIHCALEATVLLRQRDIRVALVLVGSGPAHDEIVAEIHTLGLSDQVQLLGPIFGKALEDLWNRADIFVFPTEHREGLPYALLEAMRAGAVPITTRKGGIPDVVKHNVNGLLIGPGSAEQLANAVESLHHDRAKLFELAINAQKTIHINYSSQSLIRRFHQLYEQLTDPKVK